MGRNKRSGNRTETRTSPGRSSRGSRSSRGGRGGAGSGAILAGSLAVLAVVVVIIISMSSTDEASAGNEAAVAQQPPIESVAGMSVPVTEEKPSGPAPSEPPREVWEAAQRYWTEGERLLDQARSARDNASQDEFDRMRGRAYEKLSKATAEGQRYLEWFNVRLEFDDSHLYDPERYSSFRGEHRRTEKIVQKWIKQSNEARH